MIMLWHAFTYIWLAGNEGSENEMEITMCWGCQKGEH